MSEDKTKARSSVQFDRVGIVARWQPVHLGHVPVLHGLCRRSRNVVIGIGSSNKYDYRNPFSLEERTEMLEMILQGWENYSLIPVEDLDDGPRWREMLQGLFGDLDCFVTANPYVESLLSERYQTIKPINFVGDEERVAVEGAMVRLAMAQGREWREMVPASVSDFILAHRLDERFRTDFGLQTLAMESMIRRKNVFMG
jgi:nicotinamide-nucleotide adenylyltransferase